MTIPPPPGHQPSNQPPASGGFGPPAPGYGHPGASAGHGGPPGGYGPPGPPGGGYGPPGPGGWPPPPPPGGGNRRTLVIALASVAVVGALIVGTALVLTGGDKDDAAEAEPAVSASATPAPSDTATPGDRFDDSEDDPYQDGEDPFDDPTRSPSAFDWESSMPTPSTGPRPAYQLRPGDCFDIAKDREGYNNKRSCSSSHDAEVVHQEKLTGEYETDEAVSGKAESICKGKLEAKAAKQTSGVRFRTLSQFPKASGFRLGMKTVTCSLVAAEGSKLDSPLD